MFGHDVYLLHLILVMILMSKYHWSHFANETIWLKEINVSCKVTQELSTLGVLEFSTISHMQNSLINANEANECSVNIQK